MNATSQSVAQVRNSFAWAFGMSSLVVILLLAFLLHVVGVSLAIFALVLGAGAVMWMVLRHPATCLGLFLALMSIFPLGVIVGEYFKVPFIAMASPLSRIGLVLLTVVLWRRNGIALVAADWFALAYFGLALARLAFGGTLVSLLADFNCMIAYAAGRMTVLGSGQEKLWAKCAVWIVAVLAVLGMSEVFIFGEAPRALMYTAVSDSMTEDGALNAVFHADAFAGLRESSTMLGPLTFASLCMVGLILWWVYFRNPLPGGMIAAGLICSVTRSGWLGTALAIPFLAVIMGQKKRFFIYAGLALALFVASIPVLGLGDYISMAKSGQDFSTQGHKESILNGFEYVIDHPLGVGAGNAGFYAGQNVSNGIFFESTYLTLAAEYGIPAILCFLGFLVCAFLMARRTRTLLGYAAMGILVGFGVVMMVVPLHQDFPLMTWIWFPVGLAVRAAAALQDRWLGNDKGLLPVTY